MDNASKVRLRHSISYYGLQDEFDKLYKESSEGKKFKNLMELICSEDNIRLAYRNIKSNAGSFTAGTDGIIIKDIKRMKDTDFIKLVQNKFKNYRPSEVRRVYIPKSNGKKRPLGIPTITERIVQQCIKQVLEPICEAKFHPHSYGFRPNRNVSNALFRMQFLINNSQLCYCIDADIKSFFDEVDHGKLLKQLWNLGIQDKALLSIISKMLKFKVDGVTQTKGTPQGGILSPLLANVVLNELDWWVSNQYETKPPKCKEEAPMAKTTRFRSLKNSNLKEMYIVRYADDFKIMCRNYNEAKRTLMALEKWIKERLGLTLSKEKTKIINLKKNYSHFLGVKIIAKKGVRNKYTARSKIADDRKEKIIKSLKRCISRISKYKGKYKRDVNLFNLKLMGMHNYYSCATNVFKDFKEIWFKLHTTLRNRLKNIGKYGIWESEVFSQNERYFNKRRYKTWKINGIPLIPIVDVNYKTNLGYSQKKTIYSKEGRELIGFRRLSLEYELRELRSENSFNDTIEFRDNKISKYSAQKGNCGITGTWLGDKMKNCHHVIRRADGGSDKYSNLLWVVWEAHVLIHAVKEETINKYLEIVKSISEIKEKELIKRINKYRKLAGNFEI